MAGTRRRREESDGRRLRCPIVSYWDARILYTRANGIYAEVLLLKMEIGLWRAGWTRNDDCRNVATDHGLRVRVHKLVRKDRRCVDTSRAS